MKSTQRLRYQPRKNSSQDKFGKKESASSESAFKRTQAIRYRTGEKIFGQCKTISHIQDGRLFVTLKKRWKVEPNLKCKTRKSGASKFKTEIFIILVALLFRCNELEEPIAATCAKAQCNVLSVVSRWQLGLF